MTVTMLPSSGKEDEEKPAAAVRAVGPVPAAEGLEVQRQTWRQMVASIDSRDLWRNIDADEFRKFDEYLQADDSSSIRPDFADVMNAIWDLEARLLPMEEEFLTPEIRKGPVQVCFVTASGKFEATVYEGAPVRCLGHTHLLLGADERIGCAKRRLWEHFRFNVTNTDPLMDDQVALSVEALMTAL